uniref:hypothetical protein n=1 Tax=Pedobacter schmidteae TaxID=2201271 RepID=UPI000EAFC927|nr:hypothetical protein [Pedobacter schmidteae]
MKKLLLILVISLTCSTIYAQTKTSPAGVQLASSNTLTQYYIKANQPSFPVYSNGEAYGYYIDEIPGAVSYEWSIVGHNVVLWLSMWDDKAVDLTFSYQGYCTLTCTVTMSDNSVQVYNSDIGASDDY